MIEEVTTTNPDHVFKAGSMSKPYVATAVMQMVEAPGDAGGAGRRLSAV